MFVKQGRPRWEQPAETRACTLSAKSIQENGLSSVCVSPPQVSDAENVLGIVQIENIQIHAEAYDVALSISISKGQWMPPKPKQSQARCVASARGATKALGMG